MDGQKKLLKWSLPGAAHFFVFWAFLILGTVYIEAYGALFDEDFAIPVIGHWPVLGFLQDFIALMALAGIITFAIIRLRNLGYYAGPDVEQTTPDLEAATRNFQRDHSLEETGELDSDTTAKLDEVHPT